MKRSIFDTLKSPATKTINFVCTYNQEKRKLLIIATSTKDWCK
jgi:hypothetical protein